MTKEELKSLVITQITQAKDELYELADELYQIPELGYKEVKTSAVMERVFREKGLQDIKTKRAVTGVSGELKGKGEGPKVCVIGEMDSVVCPTHSCANPETGAVHACGHHAQMTSVIGAIIGLKDSGAFDYLSGSVKFFAVPAEECIEIGFRQAMKERGEISYYGGKQELIKLGDFDDVDISMMVHTTGVPKGYFGLPYSNLGFVQKLTKFQGRAVHAARPQTGINALNAACAAIMCINSLRETFYEKDRIRVHSIFTEAGDIVNVVPAEVVMETMVRATNLDAVFETNKKVTRAIKGSAYALGCEVEITDNMGYFPLKANKKLNELFGKNASELVGDENVNKNADLGGSTDMSDLCYLMPTIQPLCGGATGELHSMDFKIVDAKAAYLDSTAAMALTVIDLLWDDAACAKDLIKEFKPDYTKEAYLEVLDSVK
jgi:amidohydrolase